MYRLYTLFIFRVESRMCLAWVGEVAGRLISQASPVLLVSKVYCFCTSPVQVRKILNSKKTHVSNSRKRPSHVQNTFKIIFVLKIGFGQVDLALGGRLIFYFV